MTSKQATPTPQFVLLVFGKPTSADLPQASWFRAEDRAAVVAAAQSLKFSVLNVQADGDRSLLEGVHEGVLKGAGRIVVGLGDSGDLQADRRLRGQEVARARRIFGER